MVAPELGAVHMRTGSPSRRATSSLTKWSSRSLSSPFSAPPSAHPTAHPATAPATTASPLFLRLLNSIPATMPSAAPPTQPRIFFLFFFLFSLFGSRACRRSFSAFFLALISAFSRALRCLRVSAAGATWAAAGVSCATWAVGYGAGAGDRGVEGRPAGAAAQAAGLVATRDAERIPARMRLAPVPIDRLPNTTTRHATSSTARHGGLAWQTK